MIRSSLAVLALSLVLNACSSSPAPDDEVLANTILIDSGWPPPGWKHAELGPNSTQQVPGDYKHAWVVAGDWTRYVPEDYEHVIRPYPGPDFSRFVPEDYKHADVEGTDESTYVPDDYQHADIQGADWSKYVPGDHKHADQEGLEQSWYVPADYEHGDVEGPEYSTYIPPGHRHVEEGPDRSSYFPEDWIHAERPGPDLSIYIDPTWEHGIFGAEPSEYMPPDFKHVWEDDPSRYWASSEDESAPTAFASNESFVRGLSASLDLDDTMAVFAFVFASLDDQVVVYPTENYYYFRFRMNERDIWGSMSLSANDRDEGVLGFGYSLKGDPSLPPSLGLPGGGKQLDASDGVIVEKVTDFQYTVTFEGRSVTFLLNDLLSIRSVQKRIRPEETYVGPAFDESGLRFYLIFNQTTNKLYWILDEDEVVPESFSPIVPNVVVGDRTGFAFFQDEEHGRKLLIGVAGLNVLHNNWYDGPFDQMPDNLVKIGEIEVRPYLEAAYPRARGRISEYGHYLDEEGVRVAVAPYRVYFDPAELDFARRCRLETEDPTGLYTCLTVQSFRVPDEYRPTTTRR